MSDEPEPRPNTFFRPPTPRPPASPAPGAAPTPAAAPGTPPSGTPHPPSGTSHPPSGPSAFEIEAMLAKDRSASTSMLIPIALVALALGALGYTLWYMTGHVSRPAEVATAPQPGAPPQISEEERRAALAALTALRDLRAVVQTNPTYQDYAQRTIAARGPVQRYASLPNINPELQASFVQAINLYGFASTAWEVGLRANDAATLQDAAQHYFSIANDPLIEVCGPLRDARNRSAEEITDVPPPVARGVAVARNVPMIWTCAAERIAQIETALGAN